MKQKITPILKRIILTGCLAYTLLDGGSKLLDYTGRKIYGETYNLDYKIDVVRGTKGTGKGYVPVTTTSVQDMGTGRGWSRRDKESGTNSILEGRFEVSYQDNLNREMSK